MLRRRPLQPLRNTGNQRLQDAAALHQMLRNAVANYRAAYRRDWVLNRATHSLAMLDDADSKVRSVRLRSPVTLFRTVTVMTKMSCRNLLSSAADSDAEDVVVAAAAYGRV